MSLVLDAPKAPTFRSLQMAQEYLTSMHSILDAIPLDAVSRLARLIFAVTERGRAVYVFGNGGSAATADHMACDLSKNTRVPGAPAIRCLSLVAMPATMTALGNDVAYASIFSETLRIYGQPGDLALGISTSGNSANVLEAFTLAHSLGLHTAALLGCQGGNALALVDLPVVVQDRSVPHLEDAHNVISHMLTNCLRGMLATYVTSTAKDLPAPFAKADAHAGKTPDDAGAPSDLPVEPGRLVGSRA